MSLDGDFKKLSSICAKCGGGCCNGGKEGSNIILSDVELKRLSKVKDFKVGESVSPFGKASTIIISKNKPCPFIGKTAGKHVTEGCILSGVNRPLGCRLFPLTFIMKGDKPVFYLSAFCPYVKEISLLKDWVKFTIKQAIIDLKSWSSCEKNCRGYWHEVTKKLIDL
ncbi:MAG TPA: hypothetical protein VI790_04475 [Candidatus Nanoarchaeia archaeon]|nr:hypothetical protein [Candidatus Nanoarchaeia archaeon]